MRKKVIDPVSTSVGFCFSSELSSYVLEDSPKTFETVNIPASLARLIIKALGFMPIVPKCGGAVLGSTTSDLGSEPRVLFPSCSQCNPTTVSQPFSDLSLDSCSVL